MTRAVADPNVLVSALISPGGAPARILEAAETGSFQLVVSRRLIGEFEDVLRREKFRRYATVSDAVAHVRRVREVSLYEEECEVEAISPDPKDDYPISLARSPDTDYLVSGDSHLLGLKVRGLSVVPPRRFLELLYSAGGR